MSRVAETLATARQRGERLAEYPGPKPDSLTAAYDLQTEVIARLDRARVGWKIGITSEAAQIALGAESPMSAPLLDGLVHPSGTKLPVAASDVRIVEPEICLRLGTDVALDADRATLVAAIDAVAPALELVNKRLPGGPKEAIEWLVADGAINQAVVTGAFLPFTPAMDLAGETVRALRDGAEISTGIGSNALGGPLNVLEWLHQHLAARGLALRAGDIVMTGLICDILFVEPGDTFTAEFRTLGTVSASF